MITIMSCCYISMSCHVVSAWVVFGLATLPFRMQVRFHDDIDGSSLARAIYASGPLAFPFDSGFLTHTHNSSHTTFRMFVPPPSPLSFLLSPCRFSHFFLIIYWKKLTCGVIRSFDLMVQHGSVHMTLSMGTVRWVRRLGTLGLPTVPYTDHTHRTYTAPYPLYRPYRTHRTHRTHRTVPHRTTPYRTVPAVPHPPNPPYPPDPPDPQHRTPKIACHIAIRWVRSPVPTVPYPSYPLAISYRKPPVPYPMYRTTVPTILHPATRQIC